MKRIILAISALAIMAGLSASCQKEIAPDNNGVTVNSGLTVTATIADNGTKVSYAEVDAEDGSRNLIPTWEVNDIIIGFDEDENTYSYKVTAVNEGVATLAIITEGDFAGTATSDPADGTTMYMIYAPGYKPTDISSKSLTVSLASQSIDVVPALMMAQATVAGNSLNLSFENKIAIIGIKTPTMAIANKSYTGIAVSGTGINTEVKFGLNASSQLEATYQTPGKIIKAFDFASDADNKTSKIIYVVACPLETAADLTFTASNGESFTKTGKTMAVGQYYYMTPTFLAPPTALSGVFSVGSDAADKVRFSPGNLRCNPVGTSGAYTSGIWSFFDKQYECGPSSYNLGHDKEISLFTWGYNATKSIVPDGSAYDNVSRTSDDLDQTEDWGSQIGDGSTWRTLTTAEWQYLFSYDGSGFGGQNYDNDIRRGKYKYGVTVCGKTNCVVLLPDNWQWDASTVGTDWQKNTRDIIEYSEETTIKWSTMQAAGAVCLPAAGCRSGSHVNSVGYFGLYWSSTGLDSLSACRVAFSSSSVSPAGEDDFRGVGASVRLITESK
ncbi:MAG: hypothetical protein MJY55_05545 [Bacteroidales bacterium]|nr:hypothetical protein [Bacteroidales bacterium]